MDDAFIFHHPIRIFTIPEIIREILFTNFTLYDKEDAYVSSTSAETWGLDSWLLSYSLNGKTPLGWKKFTHTCSMCGLNDRIEPDQLTKGVLLNGRYFVDTYYYKCSRCFHEIWAMGPYEIYEGMSIEEYRDSPLRSLENIAFIPLEINYNTENYFFH